MIYRKLPHGEEELSILGLGTGEMKKTSAEEIEAIFTKAIENGVNFFDLCFGSNKICVPFSNAVKKTDSREKIYVQMHFGAIYNEEGEYGWSRDFEEIRQKIEWELETMGFTYIDFGFLHCIDSDNDFDTLVTNGVFDYMKELKAKGVIRHFGFSSHTPKMAEKVLNTGLMDMMMFSINPAYDVEQGDELANGSASERMHLFRRCEKEGVGISVMKPFFGGKLMRAEESPFGAALTQAQCLQYAWDRPGVLTAVPGVQTLEQLDVLLAAVNAPAEERNYSVISGFTAEKLGNTCVYCNHCQPCPAGIDIGLVNKYYDLALIGDDIAAQHYDKLEVKADACLQCGHCDSRCPFKVEQGARMKKIAQYFADRARAHLSGSVTCVLKKDGKILVSEKSGIAPMMDWIAQGLDLKGYRVEDKIVGKAAAMLFVKAGIAEVYAEVLSEAGKAYLDAHGIPATYGKMTEKIINRTGDGMCPMEQTVLNIEDAEEGYAALKQKLAALRSAK